MAALCRALSSALRALAAALRDGRPCPPPYDYDR